MIMLDKPGLYDGIMNDNYHADPCPQPSLSSSIGKILVHSTPSHAWTAHPRLNPDIDDDNSKTFDLGSAAHDILLEGEKRLSQIVASDYKKDAAQEARDRAYAGGLIPILSMPAKGKRLSQLSMTRQFAQNVRAQLDLDPENAMAFKDGKPEQTLIWTEEVNGFTVWCRARPDWWFDDFRKKPVYDFKSTQASADPADLGRFGMMQGWPFQDAFYRRGMRKLFNFDPEYRFVVGEHYLPHAMSVITFPPETRSEADEQAEYAVRKWAHCLQNNEWHGYPRGTLTVGVKVWASENWQHKREMVKHGEFRHLDPVLADVVAGLNAPL